MTLILSGTDGVSDVDGSAATPAVRGADANTGIFFPAADTIAFSEGGAEVARITNTGAWSFGASGTATGTSGQVLTSSGSAAAPTWADNAVTPVGTLQYFMGQTTTTYPGSSWLKCDGSTYTQAAYPALYSRIGLYTNNYAFSWTETNTGTSDANQTVTYGNGLFVASGGGDRIYTSSDAASWTVQTAPSTSVRNAIIYGDNLYVTAGDVGNLATSTDGTTWTARTSGTTSSIRALVYGNGLYVYAGWGGMIATSTDAVTWTARTSGTTSNLFSLAYGNGIYLAGGTGGVLRTSTNGITWTARTSGTTSTILSLTYGGGIYMYGGQGGVLGTSFDGVLWRRRISGTTAAINAVAYGAGLFLRSGATTENPAISWDGVTWTTVTGMNSTVTMNGIVYGNGLFVYSASFNRYGRASAFTYNSATEFAVPNGDIMFADAPVYIKATA